MIATFIFIGFLIIGILIFLQHPLFGKKPSGKRLSRIEQSKNHKKGQFQNLSKTPALAEDTSYFEALKELLFPKIQNTKPTDTIPHIKTNLHDLDIQEDYLIWFGHSSYFMQIDHKSFLIDPVLTQNASPLYGTNKAFKGADFFTCESIPTIDYLILTHDHYDHLDYTTFKKIKHKVSQIICPLGVGAHLEHWGFPSNNIIELDWYEQTVLNNSITLTATPSRHFSGRSFKRNNTLWASYVLKSEKLKLFLGGDSGYDFHFKEIGFNHGPFDWAILENGQYDKKWKYIHLLPDDLLKATQDLNTKRLLPVHHSKFKLANHPWKEPLKKIAQNAEKIKDVKVATPMIGEIVYLNSDQQSFKHWWKNIN